MNEIEQPLRPIDQTRCARCLKCHTNGHVDGSLNEDCNSVMPIITFAGPPSKG